MLNKALADDARDQLRVSIELLKETAERATKLSVDLHAIRQSSSHELMPKVEAFVNLLAAHPKEFDRTFAEFHVELEEFDGVVHAVDEQLVDAAISSGSAAGVGTAVGTATLLGAPAAAMAIATTFGTASTGAAISTLSGAAATNAALAWLGGGALAAGGSGMAAGNALLALAGPVGWGLAAVSLAGGAFAYRLKNGAIAEQAAAKRAAVEARRKATADATTEIEALLELTKTQVSGMNSLLSVVKADAPSNYRLFDSGRKQMLGALVNHVHILSHLLNKRVGAVDSERDDAGITTSNDASAASGPR